MIPIEEIKMFLGTGLKMNYSMDDRVFTITEKLTLNDGKEDFALHHFNILGYYFKPLVRPLSKLTEEIKEFIIEELGIDITMNHYTFFNAWEERGEFTDLVKQCPLNIFEILVNDHRDVFGWLEKGLAEELKD